MPLEIASHQIQERIHTGRTIRYLVPDGVCRYIEEHGLYANDTEWQMANGE